MTTAATREPAGAGRIASLDGLRAISILAVLFGHLLGTRNFLSSDAWKSTGIGDLAHLGVRVFFVISGFLITSLLIQEMDRTRRIDLKAFYVRRVYRIFPAFYAYLIIVFIASGVGLIKVPLDDAIFAMTYTINYEVDRSWYVGHTWSLSVEEQFYMLWPATIWLAGVRRGLWASAAMVVLAPIIRIGWYYVLPTQVKLIGEAFPTVADSIALGCLLAGTRGWLERQPFYAWLMRTPAFFLVPLLAVAVNSQASHARAFWLLGETVVNASIAITVHRCILTPDGVVGRVLNSRVLSYIGVLSYSIYLWQQPFLDRTSDAFVHRFPQNIIFASVLALASYYLIEKPFLRLRHRLSASRDKSPAGNKRATA
jgi:peptidoglycan/LPS O-acetylase OafA/YrhL